MRDREGVEAPARPGQHKAGRDSAQPIDVVTLGSDRIGEIAADKPYRLAAADDLDRLAYPEEGERGAKTCEPRYMIEMKVGQEHVAEPAKSEPGAHQLALGPLAAIDEKPIRPAGNERRRQAAFGRGHRRGCA